MFKKLQALFSPKEVLPDYTVQLTKLLAGVDLSAITVLTGAGISAESGLKTFRGPDGLWQGIKVEQFCRPETFETEPQSLINFYNQRRAGLLNPAIEPNAAHRALVALEKHLPNVCVVTQNVDNLHERAGTKNLIQIHGRLLQNICHWCSYQEDSLDPIPFPNQCPNCQKVNSLRPGVVFFKERPKNMEAANLAVQGSKLFIAIGTSGVVYPAAGFVSAAKYNGAICLEINPEPTDSKLFDLQIKATATESVSKIVELIQQVARSR